MFKIIPSIFLYCIPKMRTPSIATAIRSPTIFWCLTRNTNISFIIYCIHMYINTPRSFIFCVIFYILSPFIFVFFLSALYYINFELSRLSISNICTIFHTLFHCSFIRSKGCGFRICWRSSSGMMRVILILSAITHRRLPLSLKL